MNYACPSWNTDCQFKSDTVLQYKITRSTRENHTVDNWEDTEPLIEAFGKRESKTIERVILVRFSLLQVESMTISRPELPKLEDPAKHILCSNKINRHSSFGRLGQHIQDGLCDASTARMMTVASSLCLATAARTHPVSRRVITWNLSIILETQQL